MPSLYWVNGETQPRRNARDGLFSVPLVAVRPAGHGSPERRWRLADDWDAVQAPCNQVLASFRVARM